MTSGFYRCPNPECGRIHTYTVGAVRGVVECACGALIDQFNLTYTMK